MPRKTQAERDRVNVELRIKQAKTRKARTAVVREWVQAYGTAPAWLWEVFGHAEFMRGWGEGSREAAGYDEDD